MRQLSRAFAITAAAALCACGGIRTAAPLEVQRSFEAHRAGGSLVSAWGFGDRGQLGDGKTSNSDIPVNVSPVNGTTAMAGGGAHGVLIAGGAVWAWGWNKFGELGVGTTSGPELCPQGKAFTACSKLPVEVQNLTGVTAIAGGDIHSLAIDANGNVWAWGHNQYGELGTGSASTNMCQCIDAPVQSLATGMTAIGGGGRHSLALKRNGTVWDWGLNAYGQLGDGTTANSASPVQVKNLSGVSAIAAGYYHNLALSTSGIVYAWGRNTFGQLGNGTTSNSDVPVKVHNLSNVSAIAGGGEFSLALRGDGTLWSWGDNSNGELGDGTTTERLTPVQVKGLSGVIAIGAGHQHALAVDKTGAVWAWGLNKYGELGNGTRTSSSVPVRVKNLTGVHSLGAGEDLSYALR